MPDKKSAKSKPAKKAAKSKQTAAKKKAPPKKKPAAKKAAAKKAATKKAAAKTSPKRKNAAASGAAKSKRAPAPKKKQAAATKASVDGGGHKAPAAPEKASVKAKRTPSKKKSPSKRKEDRARSASPRFSLEEALAATKKETPEEETMAARKAAKERERKALEAAEQTTEKRVFGAASLDDILGRSSKPNAAAVRDESDVPKKHRKFYKLLVQLRDHVHSGLSMHAQDTLKRSSKDDAGDLSGYSQHMADAGTDTFDRDFALSMVSNEQEALQEIDAAIDRIFKGTFGICEMTGQKIQEDRLMAVPFTRYSVETQAQLEKNKRFSAQRGGIFADASGEDSLSFGDENPDT